MQYDVNDASGALVASFSNPVTARAEARRVGGTTVPRSTNSGANPASVNSAAMVAADSEGQ